MYTGNHMYNIDVYRVSHVRDVVILRGVYVNTYDDVCMYIYLNYSVCMYIHELFCMQRDVVMLCGLCMYIRMMMYVCRYTNTSVCTEALWCSVVCVGTYEC